MKPLFWSLLVVGVAGLAGCGGGGGGGGDNEPPAAQELIWDEGNWDETDWG